MPGDGPPQGKRVANSGAERRLGEGGGKMLKILERAIAEAGGDPAELERIREARQALREYRRLREELGLGPIPQRLGEAGAARPSEEVGSWKQLP